MKIQLLSTVLVFLFTAGLSLADINAVGFLAGSGPGCSVPLTAGECRPTGLGDFVHTTVNPFLGTVETSASLDAAVAGPNDWDLSVRTSSFISSPTAGGGNLQEATAGLVVDRIGQLAGAAPFPSTLTYIGRLTGQVTVGTNSFHDGSLTFGGEQINALEELFFPDAGVENVDIPLSTTVPVSATGSFPVQYSIISQSFGRVGTTIGDLSNTLEFTSILLPNGDTPESAGFTMSFSDGAGSPNVPEPSSAFIFLFGAVCICSRWRRHRA